MTSFSKFISDDAQAIAGDIQDNISAIYDLYGKCEPSILAINTIRYSNGEYHTTITFDY